jgi:hypothetical protein
MPHAQMKAVANATCYKMPRIGVPHFNALLCDSKCNIELNIHSNNSFYCTSKRALQITIFHVSQRSTISFAAAEVPLKVG